MEYVAYTYDSLIWIDYQFNKNNDRYYINYVFKKWTLNTRLKRWFLYKFTSI